MFSQSEMHDRMNADRGYFHTTKSQAWISFCEEQGLDLRTVTKNALCPRCDGEGKRALHGIALTGSDLAEMGDPDFMENYMAGRYDTTCDDCNGEKVVRVPNEEALTPEQLQAWRKWLRDVRSANAESLMEMRAGA